MDEHAKNALARQGLTYLRELLLSAGFETEVENTGGHCMALITYVTRQDPTGAWVEDVIVGAGEGYGTYYVNRFPLDVWRGESEYDLTEFEPEAAEVHGAHEAVRRWEDLSVRDW